MTEDRSVKVYRIRDKIGFAWSKVPILIGEFKRNDDTGAWEFTYRPWATRDAVARRWVAQQLSEMNEVTQ